MSWCDGPLVPRASFAFDSVARVQARPGGRDL